jgi:hypothetical protein
LQQRSAAISPRAFGAIAGGGHDEADVIGGDHRRHIGIIKTGGARGVGRRAVDDATRELLRDGAPCRFAIDQESSVSSLRVSQLALAEGR